MARTLPPPFTITDRAQAHLHAALAKAPGKTGVRIGIKTAGCSGLKYQFTLAEQAEAGDLAVALQGLQFFIAPLAEMHVLGATLDYTTRGLSSELDFISNPNEAARCGCGESFTPASK